MSTNDNKPAPTMDPQLETLETEIIALQREYISNLPLKVQKLHELNNSTNLTEKNTADLIKFFHKIAGSASTYQLNSLAELCRYTEQTLVDKKQIRVLKVFSHFQIFCKEYLKLLEPSFTNDKIFRQTLASTDSRLKQILTKSEMYTNNPKGMAA